IQNCISAASEGYVVGIRPRWPGARRRLGGRRSVDFERTLSDGAVSADHKLVDPALGAVEQRRAVLGELRAALVSRDRLLERDAAALEFVDQRVELAEGGFIAERIDVVRLLHHAFSMVACEKRDVQI